MSNIAGRSHKIARRYGGVLFELSRKNKALNEVLQDLNLLRACIEAEPRDWSRVANPLLPLYTQRKIMESLVGALKLGKLMRDFLMVLCQNRRLSDMNFILEEFLERVKRGEGIVEGILETPVELSDEEMKDFQQSLTSKLGEKIHLNQKINESLLGGVVLRIGSLMIDGSIKTRLNKLKTVMKG
ncbi:MAG: ATP synthase F1 subunit delta [Alphaproteobacteria bacterium]|nr:ATP synthase F1 subunit delta [Alphaproteobacteria bacterium]